MEDFRTSRSDPLAQPVTSAIESILAEVEVAKLKSQVSTLKKQYRSAINALADERESRLRFVELSNIQASPPPKRPKRKRSPDSATAVVLLSDWHVEELVPPESVMGRNHYTLSIADRRLSELSDRMENLIRHERHLAKIDRIVIAALGDFISNSIHEDQAELAQLQPMPAVRWAGERIRGIIDRASDLADEVIVATAVGNHGRATHKIRLGATEQDTSYEQNLYEMMAAYEPRDNVHWQIGRGYLNVVDLDGFKVAFHHGHAIKGNIHVGATRAIAQWQRSCPVDFHCFGHHHQFSHCRGKYLSNGSVVGYNAYALRCRLEFEPPCQALAVIDHHRREVTRAIPIFCDRDLQETQECQRPASTSRTLRSGRPSKREPKVRTLRPSTSRTRQPAR